jgi:hypothetical protein
MKACSAGAEPLVLPGGFAGVRRNLRRLNLGRNYGTFGTKTAKYEDNVVAWPSVEPADDYTANSLLAFAFAAAQR